jgi:hypothetical protein
VNTIQANDWNPAQCFLCCKLATTTHIASAKHEGKLSEHVELDMLAGPTPSVRSLQTGMPGFLSRDAAAAYWGRSIHKMPEVARQIMMSKGVTIGKRHWRPSELGRVKTHLAFVTYAGPSAGKHTSRNRCVVWDAIPPTGPLPPLGPRMHPGGVWGEDPEPSSGGASSSADVPADWHLVNQPVAPTGPAVPVDWQDLWAPPLEGWWPVCVLTFEGEQLQVLATNGLDVAVVCIYQWGWPTPSAWNVSLTPVRWL